MVVKNFNGFIEGTLPSVQEDARVVHAAVTLLKDEKLRADFDVFFKKFLTSMDIILPHPAATPYRVPARRLRYIQRVARERYKDNSLDLADAGEKVKDLINRHLVSLGINPQIPPIELLAEDFIEQLKAHSGGNAEAKASEMEHAIRKHCTIHHDEDPAFYQSLSEKVDNLIDQHKDNWEQLVIDLEGLRDEAIEGRKHGAEGMSKEATTIYEHIAKQAFPEGTVPLTAKQTMQTLMEAVVDILEENIGSIDFWSNADKQKRTRSNIKHALTLTGIKELKESRERIAIEIMKLAKNRHDKILKGTKE